MEPAFFLLNSPLIQEIYNITFTKTNILLPLQSGIANQCDI